MLYNKHNLEVVKFVSPNPDVRPEISGVFFTKDKTVATDSFRLVEIGVSNGYEVKDFPKVMDKKAMRGIKPFIAEAEGIKGIKIPKRGSAETLPVSNYTAITHLDKNRIDFVTTNLDDSDVKTVKRIEGTYPEYESFIPKGEPVAEVVVNGKYLMEVVDVLRKLDNFGSVRIKIFGDKKKDKYGSINPILIEAGNDHQSGRAVLMPIRD